MGTSFKLESRAVLGLLAKANELFAEDDVTLSFPLGAPVSFDVAELSNAMGPAPDAPAHALLAEFSTMMNWIPDGIVWPPSAPRRLDDIVRYIVEQADWAIGSSTPEEEARKSAARAILDISNPIMQDYLTLRDAWIRAKQELRNRPDDLIAVEAESRAHVALIAYPYRVTIEQAQQELVTLDERAPFRTRERMQQQIDVGVGTFDDPSGGRFSPTRPLPKDVLQATAWSSVTLDRAMLDQLATAAPAELRHHLVAEGTDEDIVSVSFEYASAQLNRQWLDAALFGLRCWRFTDDDRILSDGATPPAGDCPSYVRAVVFARNVQITRHHPDVGAGTPAQGSALHFLIPHAEVFQQSQNLLKQKLDWEDPRYIKRFEHIALPDQPRQPAPDPRTDVDMLPIQPAILDRAILLNRTSMLNRATQREKLTLTEKASPLKAARNHWIGRALRRREELPERIEPRLHDALLQEAKVAPDFHLRLDPSLIVPAKPAPTGPEFSTTTSPDGQIILLALICKQLGHSPNPSPDYGWP
jgi:hypothetical protein